MNILFVASECVPFIKTGGLADVIGAVPRTLAQLGVGVRVLLPVYPALKHLAELGTVVFNRDDLHGGSAQLIAVKADGLDLLLLDAPHLFDRPGNIYLDQYGNDWHDNHLRFGALSEVAAQVGLGFINDWQPDVVHAHDWQAGLVPAYLHQARLAGNSAVPPCVLTIHNIAFQGLFNASLRYELGLSDDLFTMDGLEYYGKISFLKAGIAFSRKISTVSATYARELLTPEFGMGFERFLAQRSKDVSGILNGIDVDVWNPANDAELPACYGVDSLARKAINRAELEFRFDLRSAPYGDSPLFCVISRLTSQKGLDLLLEALPYLVERGARLAVLGTGDAHLEAGFVEATRRYKGEVGVVIGYDEALSHLMLGGSDAILVPSRFEPCGLTQLYGLRYGTLPVVARTGGLADTVIDANDAGLKVNCATGVQFSPVTTPALIQAIDRTCELYCQPETWQTMMRNAMHHPVDWGQSARAYLELYQSLSVEN